MRWDRAGVVLSELFNWCEDRKPLLTFMYAFAMATPQQQGYSSHATRATAKEIHALKEKQQHAMGKGAADVEPSLIENTDAKPTTELEDAGGKLTEEDRMQAGRATYFAEMLRDTNKWPIHKVLSHSPPSYARVERFTPRSPA